jgi:hypothetical protein
MSPGKGKRAVLRYTATAGAKQAVELAVDYDGAQSGGAQAADSQVLPTIVLVGDAETTAVAPDGAADFKLTVGSTDARMVPGSRVPLEAFKAIIGQLAGLTINGHRNANGSAGDTTLRLETSNPQPLAPMLELLRITWPSWPVLPAEPIGVGAKWRATTTSKFAGKLEVTQVTDYELAAHTGANWTLKGKTVTSGKEQQLDGGKITDVGGSGSSETTIADGALYPTHKVNTETAFTASDGNEAVKFTIKIGGAIGAVGSTAAPAPAAPAEKPAAAKKP